MIRRLACIAIIAAITWANATRAEEIAIAQYGSSTSAMPWAIAVEKGYLKDAGVDITVIRSSAGGNADIANMIADGLPYAEAAVASVIVASRNGAAIRMVSENVDTVANFVWAAMPGSPVKTLADLKGRRLTYTTPQGTSEMLDHLLVAALGWQNDDVQYVATGAYAAALAALQAGDVDVALLAEPIFTLNADNYHALAWSRDVLPPLAGTVGVVPTQVARKRPEIVRAILVAHRRAVDFMSDNRHDAAEIISHVYKLDRLVVQTLLNWLIDNPAQGGVPYFGRGNFVADGIDRMVAGLKLINAPEGGADWRSLVDQSFLPADLQRKL